MASSEDNPQPAETSGTPEPQRELSAAAKRALAEAEERRAARAASANAAKPEIGGPAGPEPTRYGDWEKGGIASDF